MMKKILIINSNYYKSLSINLVKKAKISLASTKFSVSIVDVPGVFEIPIAIRRNIKKFDGFVALGCVIKGETPHFDLICASTFNAILKLSIDFNKPIGNGVITALNMNQAEQRSGDIGSKKPNKGLEAANAVISILNNETKRI
jgi:6,7-dimethyl-8-ribityllumazine synthase